MATDFSRTLSLLRHEKGISQRKAAGEMGISQALLSHYENGIREPGLAFVVKASTGEKGTLKGSILATLQKKLVVNTANVLFDLLGKTGSRQAINAAGDYLSAALYQLLRQLYRRCGGNEDFFAVSAGDFDAGLAAADMQRSAVHYLRALGEAEKLPEVTAESITTGYPGLGQSVAQVFHNTDERCKTL